MIRKLVVIAVILVVPAILTGCGSKRANLVISRGSVSPGTMVAKGDRQMDLLGKPVEIGRPLPHTKLVSADNLAEVDLREKYRDQVMLISIVPSLDTKVCEAQTHLLGEEGDRIAKEIARITISRDTPFAQSRFSTESGLTDIDFYSDYKSGYFGLSTGLLLDGPMLLARSVLVVDRKGVVRYIQVVPQISTLPDMEKAFDKATEILAVTSE